VAASDSQLSEDEQRRRRVGAILGSIGSALEWYDFTLYVYLAPVLADLFFPSSDPLDGLLAAYGVFAAGFLMRPLGGVLRQPRRQPRANPGPSWITVAGCHRGRTLAAVPRQRPRNAR
jgi:hypothetical protein